MFLALKLFQNSSESQRSNVMSSSHNDVSPSVSGNLATSPKRKERTSKSEDRTLLDDVDINGVDERRRASCVDVTTTSTKNVDPKAEFFHTLVAKVNTEAEDDDVDTVRSILLSWCSLVC